MYEVRMRYLGALLAVSVSIAVAQEFRATISGEVTDPSGAAVDGAKVTAISLERNVLYDATSNSAGRLQYPLPAARAIHDCGREGGLQEICAGSGVAGSLRQSRHRYQARSRSRLGQRDGIRRRVTAPDRKRHEASSPGKSRFGKRPVRRPQSVRAAVRRAGCGQGEHLLGV